MRVVMAGSHPGLDGDPFRRSIREVGDIDVVALAIELENVMGRWHKRQLLLADDLAVLRHHLQFPFLEPLDLERDRLTLLEDELVRVKFQVAALDVQAVFARFQVDFVLVRALDGRPCLRQHNFNRGVVDLDADRPLRRLHEVNDARRQECDRRDGNGGEDELAAARRGRLRRGRRLGRTLALPLDGPDGVDDFLGRRGPLLPVFLQQPMDQRHQCERGLRRQLGHRLRVAHRQRHQHVHRRVAGERHGAGGQPVQHAAEAEQVGACVDLLAACLFRGHVRRRADDGPRGGQVGVALDGAGQAEVEDLDPA